MPLLRKLRRALKRKVSIFIIPHSDLPAYHLHFSFSFLGFMILLWTGLTFWAGIVSSRQLDYWITKSENLWMRSKVEYFAQEVGKSRDFLDLAKESDRQVRTLLGMKWVEKKPPMAEGGPDLKDHADLQAVLEGRLSQMPQSDMKRHLETLAQEAKRRIFSFQEIAWHLVNQRDLARATPVHWPTQGHLTSKFGYRLSPYLQGYEFHSGIDISNSPGSQVRTTADGVVRHAGWEGGYGRMILIDHGYSFSTLYAHTAKIYVQPGERVRRGQVIASTGNTGRSTANHLHYEVWYTGKSVDPMQFVDLQSLPQPTQVLALAADLVRSSQERPKR
ncbi:MAG: M23 family metallopeptidase [Elusimicrobia bacterium]|nr:M23 family metallopeptidase [Elusimicrobiota bacterium]